MALYAIGDRVTLAAARGGYDAFVTDIVGGPSGSPQYLTQSPNSGDLNEGAALVAEADIAAGPGAAPSYAVNDQITLYGMSGTVTTVDAINNTYGVTVEWFPTKHLTLTRTHLAVPAWRIAIENGG